MQQQKIVTRKKCCVCKEVLDLNVFSIDNSSPTGYQNTCKPCNKEAQRKWRTKNHDKVRCTVYRRVYGLTLEELRELWTKQDCKCAVCKDPIKAPGKSPKTHVDHDHTTGKVRGILCLSCNVALGHIKESPKVALGLLTYIQNICKSKLTS